MTGIESFKSVTEFFQDVLDLQENNLLKAITSATPWAKLELDDKKSYQTQKLLNAHLQY